MADYGYPRGEYPQDNLIEIDWCCSQCLAEGVQPGHFMCNPVDVARWDVKADTLTDSGWRALVLEKRENSDDDLFAEA